MKIAQYLLASLTLVHAVEAMELETGNPKFPQFYDAVVDYDDNGMPITEPQALSSLFPSDNLSLYQSLVTVLEEAGAAAICEKENDCESLVRQINSYTKLSQEAALSSLRSSIGILKDSGVWDQCDSGRSLGKLLLLLSKNTYTTDRLKSVFWALNSLNFAKKSMGNIITFLGYLETDPDNKKLSALQKIYQGSGGCFDEDACMTIANKVFFYPPKTLDAVIPGLGILKKWSSDSRFLPPILTGLGRCSPEQVGTVAQWMNDHFMDYSISNYNIEQYFAILDGFDPKLFATVINCKQHPFFLRERLETDHDLFRDFLRALKKFTPQHLETAKGLLAVHPNSDTLRFLDTLGALQDAAKEDPSKEHSDPFAGWNKTVFQNCLRPVSGHLDMIEKHFNETYRQSTGTFLTESGLLKGITQGDDLITILSHLTVYTPQNLATLKEMLAKVDVLVESVSAGTANGETPLLNIREIHLAIMNLSTTTLNEINAIYSGSPKSLDEFLDMMIGSWKKVGMGSLGIQTLLVTTPDDLTKKWDKVLEVFGLSTLMGPKGLYLYKKGCGYAPVTKTVS